jgi:hypothetical protein
MHCHEGTPSHEREKDKKKLSARGEKKRREKEKEKLFSRGSRTACTTKICPFFAEGAAVILKVYYIYPPP